MSACFRYPKWYVLLFFYSFFLAMPIGGFVVAISNRGNTPFNEALVGLLIVCTPFFLVPFMLLMNNFSIKIWIAENGIIYNSLFKKVEMKWSDIRFCQWNALLDLGAARGSEYLEIISVDNKIIRVFPHIMNCQTKDFCEGIEEFESAVKNYISAHKKKPSELNLSKQRMTTSNNDGALTSRDRKVIIVQMIVLPLLCLSIVHYYMKDIQRTLELVGYGTLIFLPVMLIFRKMILLESRGKLSRVAYVLATIIGCICISLNYSLFRQKEYVILSILFIIIVEVMMYMFYVTLKKGARIAAPPGNPLERAADDETGISST